MVVDHERVKRVEWWAMLDLKRGALARGLYLRGAPDSIRTSDPRDVNAVLWASELQVHIYSKI